jgi:hypothetical protein
MTDKKLNMGIQILRFIFSFHILVFHCINRKLFKSKFIKFIVRNVDIDLGTFFIISFYYSYNSFTLRNIVKIKQRFYRLLIPYIIWPFVYFIAHNFICYINGKQKNYIRPNLLYYQLITGIGIYIVFWFQFQLIFLSVLFLIIIFFSKNNYFLYLIIIGICLFSFLTSDYYKHFFSYKTIVLDSIRNIPLSYIYVFFGFTLFHLNNVVQFQNYRIKYLFINFIAFYFYIYENNLLDLKAYIYIIKIAVCISLFIVFLILPLHEINYNLFKFITSYTAGIYYLHPKMRDSLEFFFKSMKSKTIGACIINYLMCYLFCFIGSKLFKKVKLRYLFE